MTPVQEHITHIRCTIPDGVTLVCVSKFHPSSLIGEAYEIGERDFGESRVQELCQKAKELPGDIRWHMIGHLQRNKVREIIPFVHLIHSVDSLRLLETIEQEAARIDRKVRVLLEVHVAHEESKSGFLPEELPTDFSRYPHVEVCGIMTMATNTDDEQEWRRCFRAAKAALSALSAQTKMPLRPILSMGMSEDYAIAIEEGANMVRIGSSIFGNRTY